MTVYNIRPPIVVSYVIGLRAVSFHSMKRAFDALEVMTEVYESKETQRGSGRDYRNATK